MPQRYQERILQMSNFEHIMSTSGNLRLCDMERLLKNLLWICKFAFDEDYLKFKNDHESHKRGFNSHGKYVDFLSTEEGFALFLGKYPLLPELLETYVHNIDRYIGEIRKHYAKDRENLISYLGETIPLGEIVHVDLGAGDMHQEGRCTAILHLDCGRKVVYKPRSGGLDIAFNTVLDRVNNEVEALHLKTMGIYDRGKYTWTTYIDHIPCNTGEELSEYYKRCGALLGLIYLLRGTDFHFENIIAHGKYPVIIDLECLFNQVDQEHYNILSTGLVPSISYKNGCPEPSDMSGFGASGIQQSMFKVWEWEGVGTASVQLKRKNGVCSAEKNQPILNGKPVSPKAYLKEIMFGFTAICTWVLQNKEHWGNDHPFSSFQQKTIRVVPRYTQQYYSILENSFLPQAFRSKQDRLAIIQKYVKDFPMMLSLKENKKKKLLAYECQAIEQMDIPYFLANTSGTFLKKGDCLVDGQYYEGRPYDLVMNKIQELDEEEVREQLLILESIFSKRYPSKKKLRQRRTEMGDTNGTYGDTVIQEAIKIADRIAAQAFKKEGQFFWKTFRPTSNNQHFLDVLEPNVYSGTLGIAVFMSALCRYTGNSKYQKVVVSLLENKLHKNDKEWGGATKNISFSAGVSGRIYALLKADSIKYADKALDLSTLITEKAIREDQKIDIIGGISGCLIVLTHLYRLTKSERVLEKIEFMAQVLLEKRTVDHKTGLHIWKPETFKVPLTGFSHGASGIAYALLKAFEVTKNGAYKKAFYETMDYEDRFFDRIEKNWADLRRETETYSNMWCHGAPGIGLGRVYAYGVLKDPRFLVDVQHAVDTVRSLPRGKQDFYCCGNIGRLDFLLEAGNVLQDRELYGDVQQKIQEIIGISDERGKYGTYGLSEIEMEDPSLFRGLSGIGYVMLRSAHPHKIPSMGLLQ